MVKHPTSSIRLRRTHFIRTACLLVLGASLTDSSAMAQTDQEAFYLPRSGELPEILVFPPRDQTVKRPVVVMLHGMCDTPENECPRLAEAFANQSWLVCPRGDTPCASGGASWSMPRRSLIAEAALEALRAAFPGRVDEANRHTLAGFSLGAFAAVDCSNRAGGSFSNLVLIGASVEPSVERLQAAGIRSVVLMAGEWDMTFNHMTHQAERLTRRGIRSRFIGLGRIGHGFPSDINQRLSESLEFVRGEATVG
jgi:predicted esterase